MQNIGVYRVQCIGILFPLCAAVSSYEMKHTKRKGHITGWNRFETGAHRKARLTFQNWILMGKRSTVVMLVRKCFILDKIFNRY